MKIVQITSSEGMVYGLGSNQKVYVWDREDCKWIIDNDDYVIDSRAY